MLSQVTRRAARVSRPFARYSGGLAARPFEAGAPEGSQTSGNYGDLPVPLPWWNYITQDRGFGFSWWFFGYAFAFLCCPGPFWLLPLYNYQRKQTKEAAEKYGPTRYGKGQRYFL